jgi:HSP20 family protein
MVLLLAKLGHKDENAPNKTTCHVSSAKTDIMAPKFGLVSSLIPTLKILIMTYVKFNHQHPKNLNQWVNRLFDEDFLADSVFGFPPVNIFDNKDKYSVELSAPGYEKNDFKVQLEKNVLTVSAEKKETVENNEGRQVRKEFSLRSFKRSFNLDEKVDVNGIVAKYDNGVLKLTLPKKEEEKEASKDITVL